MFFMLIFVFLCGNIESEKIFEERRNIMGLFILPLVLIELPFILPELIFTYFVDTIDYIFSGSVFKDIKYFKENDII